MPQIGIPRNRGSMDDEKGRQRSDVPIPSQGKVLQYLIPQTSKEGQPASHIVQVLPSDGFKALPTHEHGKDFVVLALIVALAPPPHETPAELDA